MRSWIHLALGTGLAIPMVVSAQAPAPTRTVTGSVRDSITGQPLTAGSVTVRGTRIGAALREDGRFTLAGVPAADTVGGWLAAQDRMAARDVSQGRLEAFRRVSLMVEGEPSLRILPT